jgi:hypothetical protein
MKRRTIALVPEAARQFRSPLLTELRPTGTDRVRESPELPVAPFERAVLSWNGVGDWRLELRLRVGGAWTPYALMALTTPKGTQRSATREEEAALKASPVPVSLEIDTLVVKGGMTADAFQVRATGTGELRALSVTHYRRYDSRYTTLPAAPDTWGKTLPVPERAQRDCEEPSIRGEVCSPTSVSMVLAYWGVTRRTIDTARAVFDAQAKIYGNWAANAAYAAREISGWAAVAKLRGWDEVEREIAERRPVILSHRWNRGDLSNAPVSSSDGHLIVAVGFTPEGDVVVNDPAGKTDGVRRVYKRAELFRTWQERGEGIAYLVHPLPGV